MALEDALAATSEDLRGKIAESTQRKGNVSVIALGADHAGFALKQVIIQHLLRQAHEVVDCGTHDESRVDYPDYGAAVGLAVINGDAECGVGEELLWQLEKCLVFGQRPFTTRQLLV